MRIDTFHLGDLALELERFLGVKFGGKGVVRPNRRRNHHDEQTETGPDQNRLRSHFTRLLTVVVYLITGRVDTLYRELSSER